jgi:hypothetical protein
MTLEFNIHAQVMQSNLGWDTIRITWTTLKYKLGPKIYFDIFLVGVWEGFRSALCSVLECMIFFPVIYTYCSCCWSLHSFGICDCTGIWLIQNSFYVPGAQVALYCSRQFHIELANDPEYDNNLRVALERVYFRLPFRQLNHILYTWAVYLWKVTYEHVCRRT